MLNLYYIRTRIYMCVHVCIYVVAISYDIDDFAELEQTNAKQHFGSSVN